MTVDTAAAVAHRVHRQRDRAQVRLRAGAKSCIARLSSSVALTTPASNGVRLGRRDRKCCRRRRGGPIADPIIGLVITLVILKVTWDAWWTVRAAA